MTNPIAADKLSTHLDARERKVDARDSDRAASTGKTPESTSAAVRRDSADVGRASERLAQQRVEDSARSPIDSAQQARARVAQLQLDIARDPQGVVGAFSKLTQNAFSAAIAEPSD